MNDNDIKCAYENMNPTPEAEARMLENILATNSNASAQGAADAGANCTTVRGSERVECVEGQPDRTGAQAERITVDADPYHAVDPATSERKKRAPWSIILPIAACLVLLAGIGVFAFDSNASHLRNASPESTTALSGSTSSDQALPESESNGSAVPDAAAEHDYAHRFPTIELKAGNKLHIVTTDGSVPLLVDETKLGQELGSATARSEDGIASIGCTVYEYHDEKYPYVIRYGNENEYYLAVPDKE